MLKLHTRVDILSPEEHSLCVPGPLCDSDPLFPLLKALAMETYPGKILLDYQEGDGIFAGKQHQTTDTYTPLILDTTTQNKLNAYFENGRVNGFDDISLVSITAQIETLSAHDRIEIETLKGQS